MEEKDVSMPFDGKNCAILAPSAALPTTASLAFAERSGPEWLGALQRRLDRLAQLEVNWDSYDAPPISLGVREFAYDVAEFMARAMPELTLPDVWPTAAGGVELEWRYGDDHFASAEIDPSVGWTIAYSTPSAEGEVVNPSNVQPLVDALRWILTAN